MNGGDFRYQPFFCEENAWWLCQHPALGAADREVVFITNPDRQCVLLHQRAVPPGEPVTWDYHVVVVAEQSVWDLDSRLGMPVAVLDYLDATFPGWPPHLSHLAPQFRVVEAAELLRSFRTDRGHMRRPDGTWLQAPPSWEPPGAALAGPANQLRFVDLTDDIAGEVMDLTAFRRRYAG